MIKKNQITGQNNSLLMTLEKIVQVCFVSAFFFIAPFLIEKETFGALLYLDALIVMFSIFNLAGLDGILQTKIYEMSSKEASSALLATYILKVIFSTVGATLYVIYIFVFSYDDSFFWMYLCGGIAILFKVSSSFYIFYVRSDNVKDLVFYGVLASLLSAFCKIIFVLCFNESKWVLLTLIFDPFIYFLLLSTNVKSLLKYSISYKFFRENSKLLLTFWVSSLAILLFSRLDQVFIKEFLGAAELAEYGLLVKFSAAIIIVVNTYSISWVSYISKNKEKVFIFKKRIREYIKVMLPLSVIMSISVAVVTYYYFKSIYGQEVALHYFLPSIVIYFVMCAHLVVSKLIEIYACRNVMLIASVSALITNVTMNYLLIIRFGVDGVIFSTVMSWLLAVSILTFYSYKSYRDIKYES